CVANTFLNTRTSTAYVKAAGTILDAPGYHAGENQNYRAVIANNIISNYGGTLSQGSFGIVVNATADSIARQVSITGNVITVGGDGISLVYTSKAHVADNVITIHNEGSATTQRGINIYNIRGDIEIVDNLIDSVRHGVSHTTNVGENGRIWVKGNTITSGGPSIDLRGLDLAVITGNTVGRTGGSTAINLTSLSSKPVGKLIFDDTNYVLEGTISLNWGNITAFEGVAPPTSTTNRPSAAIMRRG